MFYFLKNSITMKHHLLIWLAGLCCLFILPWCNEEKINKATDIDTNYQEKDKEIITIMEKFSHELNITNPISQHLIERNDTLDDSNFMDIDWYIITWSWIKSNDINFSSRIFDWWHVEYLWDEPFWSYVEYSNKDIFCLYLSNLEQEIPYELLLWEDEEWNAINYEEEWKKFDEKATYYTELSCWRIPEWVHRLKDLSINADGQEPFWMASIRWGHLNFLDANWIKYYYLNEINYNNDNITFSWYQMSWKLVKTGCVDLWKWDNHEYQITLDLVKDNEGNSHYEWCADNTDLGFKIWEEWTLKNFIKKTNYDYQQPYSIESVSYTINDIVNNYMEVNFYSYSEDKGYNNYQTIMEYVDGEWLTLFEWNWYEISDDECERLNQYDNNLMDIFFLTSCPRW